MEQLSLLDWLDKKRVIVELPPNEHIRHRAFIIEQLKPIFRELEALELSDSAISEAMAYYQHQYQEKHQNCLISGSSAYKSDEP